MSIAVAKKRVERLEKQRLYESETIVLIGKRAVMDGEEEDFAIVWRGGRYAYTPQAKARFAGSGVRLVPPAPLRKSAFLNAKAREIAPADGGEIGIDKLGSVAPAPARPRRRRDPTPYELLKDRILAEIRATPGADLTTATNVAGAVE